jgi:hypothetical protein
MDIKSLAQNIDLQSNTGTLLENYLQYWTAGQPLRTSGLVAELANSVNDLEPELANEYKNLMINLYNSKDKVQSERSSLEQLSDIIAQKQS